MLLRLSFFVLSPAFLFLFSLKKKKNNLGALLVLGLLNNLQLFYIYIYIYALISLVFMLLANTSCLHFLFCHDLCFIVFALLGHVFRPFRDLQIFCPLMNFVVLT